ncbi:hypothetical protein [Nocardia gipuzkoensis]
MAFFREQRTAVRLLIAAGASVDTVGTEGDTLLLCAVEPTIPNSSGSCCCVVPAARSNALGVWKGSTRSGWRRLNVDAVCAILAAGANANTPDADYRRPLERPPERTAEDAAAWDEIAAVLHIGVDDCKGDASNTILRSNRFDPPQM